MVKVFHYTTRKGYEGIRSSKKILQSVQMDDGDDAAFGTGVYFTKLDHRKYNKKDIPKNNYGNRDGKLGHIEYCIEVDIPESLLKEGKMHSKTNRDVWLYQGEVDLSKFKHECVKVDE